MRLLPMQARVSGGILFGGAADGANSNAESESRARSLGFARDDRIF